ncbi:hypothetical protein KAU11_09765, partial [Candidatus Babeliales bacterium]|nr:hypothetical protein [Candidatus Babeliales bacterium]
PDKWIVLKISNGEDVMYKVLTQTYGGYASGDGWRLNSGVSSIEENRGEIMFHGYSGSIYYCKQSNYGTGGLSSSILESLKRRAQEQSVTIEVMDKSTDWLSLKI